MAKQLGFAFGGGALQPINWRALDRRARRVAASIAAQCSSGVREGFEIRRYADEVMLLSTLRRMRAGRRAVRIAVTSAGRSLERRIERLEERVMEREGSTLCG